MAKLQTLEDAYLLLQQLDTPNELLIHIKLVQEAAKLLIQKYYSLGLPVDKNFILIGVVIHDIGKIKHTYELFAPGDKHEKDGEILMLNHGIEPKLARCCVSHAQWKNMDCSFEELTVALADKLWRGKRVKELELEVINHITKLLSCEKWKLFLEMDTTFEKIASGGDERLILSKLTQ